MSEDCSSSIYTIYMCPLQYDTFQMGYFWVKPVPCNDTVEEAGYWVAG